jgi:hypothetical protein
MSTRCGVVSRLLIHGTSVPQAKAFAKAVTAGTKKVVDDVSTEVKLARQYEGAVSAVRCVVLLARSALVGVRRVELFAAVQCQKWSGKACGPASTPATMERTVGST